MTKETYTVECRDSDNTLKTLKLGSPKSIEIEKKIFGRNLSHFEFIITLVTRARA